jgi:thymidylate synthase (FAD)
MGSDKTIVNAARVSFGIEKEIVNEKDKKLIRYLIDHKHTSTLEHNILTLKFCVPMFVRSQHMRHRTWSYNEISRRYTSKNMQFYCPENFRTQHKRNRQASNLDDRINPKIYGTYAANFIKDHSQASLEAFNDLLSKGVCREQARMILPQNLYTEYYGTVNLSNLYKFVSLRLHEGAQWEIQQVAKACLEIATNIWPTPTNHFKKINNIDYDFKSDWKIQSTGT